jgi:hypothetical protein
LEAQSIRIEDLIQSMNEEGENIKNYKKKRIQALFSEVKAMQEIKFVDNYYQTESGKEFVQLNPRPYYIKKQKKDDHNNRLNGFKDEMLDNNEMGGYDDIISQTEQMNKKQITPIIYLENEKNNNLERINDNMTETTKLKKNSKILPSIHKRKMEFIKKQEEQDKVNTEDWYQKRTYQFNHDGSPRKFNPCVPKYLKTTFPEAEFNEDYIAVEKLTDKRLKTSSVAKRLYFNAPSVNQIRKNGQHNFLSEALDKRKTYEEMMERVNLMITSELCDPLNKMLKVNILKFYIYRLNLFL